jgi:hypothetical protein
MMTVPPFPVKETEARSDCDATKKVTRVTTVALSHVSLMLTTESFAPWVMSGGQFWTKMKHRLISSASRKQRAEGDV